jgi:acyl-CoA synthetase (NDP forming)
VLLYRAGRTPAGAQASASHTASIAGDYTVMRGLAEGAGVVVADSIGDFEDLVLLFSALGRRTVTGWRLAAVSNAGFECVAIADNLGRFTLPPFGSAATRTLEEIFGRSRIDKVVDVHNPIDLTPMTGDEAYADTVRAVVNDPDYDAAVVGVVPLTAALNTLSPGAGHREDVSHPEGIVARLAALKDARGMPWVVVVDAGALYDPMARALTAAGIPTFREADRALRLLNVYCESRMRGRASS